MGECEFGGTISADLYKALEDVPKGSVSGKVICGKGHRMALLSREQDTLYTGEIPVELSDSAREPVHVWCHAAGCPDSGLWEIDLPKLRRHLRWRKGVLELKVADIGVRPKLDD